MLIYALPISTIKNTLEIPITIPVVKPPEEELATLSSFGVCVVVFSSWLFQSVVVSVLIAGFFVVVAVVVVGSGNLVVGTKNGTENTVIRENFIRK